MKRTLLAALAVVCVGATGCATIAYDENGDPFMALQVTTTDAEPKNAFDRAADRAVDAAPAVAPFLDLISPGAGQTAILGAGVLGALGYGSRRGRKTTEDKYQYADKTYYEGRQEERAIYAPPPVVNAAEVSA